METAAKLARAGNRVLSWIAMLLILLMLSYGGYSLWDTWMIYQGGFIDDDLLALKPTGDTEDNPTLEELQQINPDVRAWLTIDDTHIDYPVVQGKTDMEYINKNVYGEFELSGAIFLSSLNSSDFSDQYNLIYGHHMESGSMFGDVVHFVDTEYFSEHESGFLYLPDKTYKIKLFACISTDAFDENIYNVSNINNDIRSFLSYLKQKSVQYRDIGITEADAIVGLSTCSEATTNGRVILFGRLEN